MRLVRLLRRLGAVLTTLVLLAVAAAGGALFLTLPRPADVATIPGLSGGVTIGYDVEGVPHIQAANEADAAVAIGYVHARDRLFQMDLMRRVASGRVAELAGPRALPLDRVMRTLGLRQRAEGELAALPPGTRAILDAYARGVNAFIASHGRWSALQFVVLGQPGPWSAVDSLLWGKTMGLYLSGNWRSELTRASLAGTVPRALLDQLWPAQDATPGPSAGLAEPRFAGLAHALDAAIPSFPAPFTLPDQASNEWAVDGAHSTTGAPLLAGDPHLAYTEPGLWHLARVDWPGHTLAGAFAPGVPLLVIGRNAALAWTFTTTGADTQDIFTETVLPGGRYATPDGPARFVTRTERIRVRGAPDELLSVRETRHGPVVSDLAGNAAPAGTAFAVQMANLMPGDDAATGLLTLDRASSVAEAGQAAALVTSPVQNLLVADRDGIGQFTTGRIPVRRAGDGDWPQPGADGAHDWIGWASGDALPHSVNPASGHLLNANERIAPASFPVFMGKDWFGDWRARRIRTLLGTGPHSVADFTSMQVDATSSFAQEVLPVLRARPRPPGLPGQALPLLDGWDGRMAMDLPQPVIFTAWLQRFEALVLERYALSPSAVNARADFVAAVLSPAGGHWCGGECGPLLDQALADALPPLARRLGPDPAAWRWGSLHVATFADAVLPLLTRRIPQPGDDTTIFIGAGPPGSLDAVHGPGYRGVYDLADLDRSRFIMAPGQSANPLSPHFTDLLHRWRDGATFTLPKPPAPGGDTIQLLPPSHD